MSKNKMRGRAGGPHPGARQTLQRGGGGRLHGVQDRRGVRGHPEELVPRSQQHVMVHETHPHPNQTVGYKGPYGHQKRGERDGKICVRYKCSFPHTKTIQDVLRQRPGWLEVKDDDYEWDFYWCDLGWLRKNFDHSHMKEHVRICHFRNYYELTRKNLMVKNLMRYRKTLEREAGRMEAAKCDFFPRTFDLPNEYYMLEVDWIPGSTWIMKPVARSEGKGIFLFRKLKDIIAWKKEPGRDTAQVERYVAQRYIENPYLIGGKKFDLRMYVLVTSYTPLRAWLYRDGFARFSSTRFSLTRIDDQYAHLTNVAVQKTAPDYDPEKGCKWPMEKLRRYLTGERGDEAVETLFKDIDNIFIRSLQSVQKIIINDKHCFELYGYDILLDHDLKPWLIEVNASLSLTASNQEDYELKCRLLKDTLDIVDMEGRLTGKEKRVGDFELWNDGPVSRQCGGCGGLVGRQDKKERSNEKGSLYWYDRKGNRKGKKGPESDL